MRLNLGCGTNIKKGYTNVDQYRNKGVDRVHDLNRFPYPFKDNSAELILLNNVLEHLKADFDKIMNEIKRILKPNGKVIIIVPHGKSNSAFDPFHHKTFRAYNFMEFHKKNVEKNEWYYGFKLKKLRLRYYKPLKKVLPFLYFFEYIINLNYKTTYYFEFTGFLWGINDIYVELMKK